MKKSEIEVMHERNTEKVDKRREQETQWALTNDSIFCLMYLNQPLNEVAQQDLSAINTVNHGMAGALVGQQNKIKIEVNF